MSPSNRVPRLGGIPRLTVFASLYAVVVIGVAFGLQAIGLRRPRPEELFAARAAAALRLDGPLVLAGHVAVDGRDLSSICLSGSFRLPGHGSARAHGFGIRLADGSRFVAVGNTILSVGRPTTPTLARTEVRLTCPAVLAKIVSRRVALWSGISVTTVTVDGRSTYKIRLQDPPVKYLADRRTLRSIDVRVSVGSVTGWSDLSVRRLSAGEIRSLRRGFPG
jgi:hypothetical protein